jgi:hypothetical protein
MTQNYRVCKVASNSFGGGDVIIDVLKKHGVSEFLDSYLGQRHPRAQYTYAEAVIHWFVTQCRNHNRIENMYKSQKEVKKHPRFNKGMSPDTFLYSLKELARPNIYMKKNDPSIKQLEKEKKGERYEYHEVNIIERYNEMLVDIAIKLGLLKKGVKYILDYDTTELETKIKGGRKYYKGNGRKAYSPAVSMIENIPLFIENRNGDSNASFNLVNSIESVLDLLKRKGITVELIRIDAAAFSREFTEFVGSRGLKYVTRPKSPTVKKQSKRIRNWIKTTIKKTSNEIGDTVFLFGKDESRMVVKKVLDENGKPKYWGLITNDFEMSNVEIINTYALRGDCENLFSSLNEFGWKVLPMRKFEHNTVYLYITAFNYILFRFIKKLFSSVMPKRVWESMELKTFFHSYISVVTRWVKGILKFDEGAEDYLALSGFT